MTEEREGPDLDHVREMMKEEEKQVEDATPEEAEETEEGNEDGS
jgi:hypothetical protein